MSNPDSGVPPLPVSVPIKLHVMGVQTLQAIRRGMAVVVAVAGRDDSDRRLRIG
jgi:hypothetical protein